MKSDRFYLACLRDTVGTNVSFHGLSGGYTSDIDKARSYSREEAQSEWNSGRSFDLPPLCADKVDALASTMWIANTFLATPRLRPDAPGTSPSRDSDGTETMCTGSPILARLPRTSCWRLSPNTRTTRTTWYATLLRRQRSQTENVRRQQD